MVDTSFWMNGKMDDFTPEDKYFMLYLLTNPFTTQLGIYEISIKQVAFQLGYPMETVRDLIDRFENKYGMILFSKETNEIAIKNYLRHSIVKGGAPVRDCLIKEILLVKNKDLIARVFAHIKGYSNLNKTVVKLISEYEESNGDLRYCHEKNESSNDTSNESYNNENDNENENENDNENENGNENAVSFHDTKHRGKPPFKATPKKSGNPFLDLLKETGAMK